MADIFKSPGAADVLMDSLRYDYCEDNRAGQVLYTTTVLTALSLTAVIFRFMARYTLGRGYHSDDWTMLIGMILGTVNCGLVIALYLKGAGTHLLCYEPNEMKDIILYMWICQIMTFVGIFFVKLSITIFVLKMGGLRRIFRIALISNICLLGITTLCFLSFLFAQCRPIEGLWDIDLRSTSKCLPQMAFRNISYASSAVAVVTDFGCAFLPVLIIYDLKLSKQTKISVLCLMGLGFVAMACGIMRIIQCKGLLNMLDITWELIPIGVWTFAELYVGIIAGCLPPCRALYLRTRKWTRSWVASSRSNTGSGTSAKSDKKLLSTVSSTGQPFQKAFRAPVNTAYFTEKSDFTQTRASTARHSSAGGSLFMLPIQSNRNPDYYIPEDYSESSRVKGSMDAEGIMRTIQVEITHAYR